MNTSKKGFFSNIGQFFKDIPKSEWFKRSWFPFAVIISVIVAGGITILLDLIYGNGGYVAFILANSLIIMLSVLTLMLLAMIYKYENGIGKKDKSMRNILILLLGITSFVGALYRVGYNMAPSERKLMEERCRQEQKGLQSELDAYKKNFVPKSVLDSQKIADKAALDAVKNSKGKSSNEDRNRIARLQDSLQIALNRKCPDCPQTAATVNLDSLKQVWTDEYVKNHPPEDTKSKIVQKDNKPNVLIPKKSAATTRTSKRRAENTGYVPRRITTEYGCGQQQGRRSNSVDRTQDQR